MLPIGYKIDLSRSRESSVVDTREHIKNFTDET